MESKSLVKLTYNIVASRFFARTPSRILRIVKICDVGDLFLRKPFWFFRSMLSILGSMRLCNRALSRLDEIPPEVWKIRKFDDILLRYCNAVYNQNTIDKWTKGCILRFPNKGDLGIDKNDRSITFISIAVKIYNALLLNHMEPKIDKVLKKNQNGFQRNQSMTSQILTIRRILCVRAKTSKKHYYL